MNLETISKLRLNLIRNQAEIENNLIEKWIERCRPEILFVWKEKKFFWDVTKYKRVKLFPVGNRGLFKIGTEISFKVCNHYYNLSKIMDFPEDVPLRAEVFIKNPIAESVEMWKLDRDLKSIKRKLKRLILVKKNIIKNKFQPTSSTHGME